MEGLKDDVRALQIFHNGEKLKEEQDEKTYADIFWSKRSKNSNLWKEVMRTLLRLFVALTLNLIYKGPMLPQMFAFTFVVVCIIGLVVIHRILAKQDKANLSQEFRYQMESIEAIEQARTAMAKLVVSQVKTMPLTAQKDRKEDVVVVDYERLTQPIELKALHEALEQVRRPSKYLPQLSITSTVQTEPLAVLAPSLDLALLSEWRQLQIEGKPDIIQELAEAFQFETSSLLEALYQAVVEGRPQDLRRAAHNLNDCSRSMGASTMIVLSAELEAIGNNGTVEGAVVLIQSLKQEYQRVRQALAAGQSIAVEGVVEK